MEALSGIETGIEDPFMETMGGLAGQDLQPHQTALIDEVLAKTQILQ